LSLFSTKDFESLNLKCGYLFIFQRYFWW